MPTATEATQYSNDIARSYRKFGGGEIRIVACADRNGIAKGIGEVMSTITIGFGEISLSAVREVYAREADKRKLVGIRRIAQATDVVEVLDGEFALVRPALPVYVLLEILVGCTIQVAIGVAYLLFIAVDGDAQSFERDLDLLSGCVFVVNAALVHEKRDASCFVLNVQRLEDVAGAIIAADACFQEKAVLNGNSLCRCCSGIFLAQFGDGDGLRTCRQRVMRRVERRRVIVAGASGKSQRQEQEWQTQKMM